MKEKAIVVLSGGLDSTVALAKAMQTYEVLFTLTFNYGQRSFGRELKASKEISLHYKVPHQVVPLPWLSDCLPKAMAHLNSGQMNDIRQEAWSASTSPRDETEKVWIPNRNGLFLNIAAALAEANGATILIFGANAEEATNFPDNTPAFRERMNEVFKLSTLNHVRVETPVGDMNKREIVEDGIMLKAPLTLVWSCYGPGPLQCGNCPSCRLLKQALSEAKPLEGKTPAIAFTH